MCRPGCSDAPKIVNLSGSHGRRGDDTVRISRIAVQPGASDSESRLVAEIVAGRLKRELEATIPVVYADPFRTPAGPERLAGGLVLELSTFEPVFKPSAQDKARFRIGVRLTEDGRPFRLNPRLRDLQFPAGRQPEFPADERGQLYPLRPAQIRLEAGRRENCRRPARKPA